MYNCNGIVYGGEPEKHLKVKKMDFLPGNRLLLSFNDGKTKVFDANTLSGEVFMPLKDEKILKEGAIEHGVPTWCNGEIDCAPEFLYENSIEYTEE